MKKNILPHTISENGQCFLLVIYIWILVVCLTHAEICTGNSLPLTSTTSVAFTGQNVTTGVKGCINSWFVGHDKLYHENHAIHIRQRQTSSQIYLNFSFNYSIPLSLITIILDAADTTWYIDTSRKPDNMQLKFMVSSSSKVVTTARLNQVGFKSEVYYSAYDTQAFYKNEIFFDQKITTFTQLDDIRMANITLKLGEASVLSTTSNCPIKDDFLPSVLSVESFETTNSTGCESLSLQLNSLLHVIDAANTRSGTISVRYVSFSPTPLASVLVLRSAGPVLWDIKISAKRKAGSNLNVVISNDGCKTRTQDGVIVHNMDLSSGNYLEVIMGKFNVEGFTYNKYEEHVPFILVVPGGIPTDVYSAFMGPPEVTYSYTDFVTFISFAECMCPFNDKSFHIDFPEYKFQFAEGFKIDPKHLYISMESCPVSILNNGKQWSFDILEADFDRCGVFRTKNGRLQVSVSLHGLDKLSGLENRLPIQCDPNMNDTSIDFPPQPGKWRDYCDIEAFTNCDGENQLRFLIPTNRMKDCGINATTINEILRYCDASMMDLDEYSQVTIASHNAEGCPIILDAKGYYFQIEKPAITISFDVCTNNPPQEELSYDMDVLSGYPPSIVSFPVPVDSQKKAQMYFLKIYNKEKRHVLIDSCDVSKPGLLGLTFEPIVKNNCPVNKSVRFLSPSSEEHVQTIMFDAASMIRRHGNFIVTCQVRTCSNDYYGSSMEIMCINPHGYGCKQQSITDKLHIGGIGMATVQSGQFQIPKIDSVADAQSDAPPTSSDWMIIIGGVCAAFLLGVFFTASICFIRHKSIKSRNKQRRSQDHNQNGVCVSENYKQYMKTKKDMNGGAEHELLLQKTKNTQRNSNTTTGISLHYSNRNDSECTHGDDQSQPGNHGDRGPNQIDNNQLQCGDHDNNKQQTNEIPLSPNTIDLSLISPRLGTNFKRTHDQPIAGPIPVNFDTLHEEAV